MLPNAVEIPAGRSPPVLGPERVVDFSQGELQPQFGFGPGLIEPDGGQILPGGQRQLLNATGIQPGRRQRRPQFVRDIDTAARTSSQQRL